MQSLVFSNLINGEKICLSGKYFRSNSEYFPNYFIKSANSGPFDIAVTIAKAKIAIKELADIPIQDRKNIAEKLITGELFDSFIENHIVKMSGLPLGYQLSYNRILILKVD